MSSVAEEVASRLTPYLGALNAKVRVKAVAEKKLGVPTDQLAVRDVAALLEGLRPALSMLMGSEAAGDLIRKIEREVC